MSLLVVGLVLFLGIHSVSIVAPGWRDAQIRERGEATWKGLYSVLSVIALVLLIYGFGQARLAPIQLYTPPVALRHLALLLMLPVFPLFLAAYFPGRIQRLARHPMLLSVKLWATAHLLANGTLADVLLFGGFLVWAIADRISVKRRAVPHKVPGAPPGPLNDIIALVGGLAVYALFLFWLHVRMVGVSPLG
jgi:uncharacterized membrane protein